ncbi:hypothetical protein KJ885_05145 [Patescibacteria group bacterium]|nr:hypothetical protein [Patescibacteria group bacterium]
MEKRMMFVAALMLVFVAANAHGEEFRAKIVCSNGICVPTTQGVSVSDMKKLAALSARAARLRRAINEVDGRDRSRVDQFITDVNQLKHQVADMEKALQELGADAKTGKIDSAAALAKLKNMEKALGLLGDELSSHRHALQKLVKKTRRLAKRPTANMEFAGWGAVAYKYGPSAGGSVSVALPMGESGLWTTRLTAGLGVSPSAGLGWLATGSLTRFLFTRDIAVGPAILGMGDAGDLLGEESTWLLAGGVEFRLKLGPVHLVATPFLGVTNEGVGHSMWTSPTYKSTVCGPTLVKAGYWTKTGESDVLSLTGGILVSVAVPLF